MVQASFVEVEITSGETVRLGGKSYKNSDSPVCMDADSARWLEGIGRANIIRRVEHDYVESFTTEEVTFKDEPSSIDDESPMGILDVFDEKTAELLIDAGFETVDDVLGAGLDGLTAIKGVGKAKAQAILDTAKGLD